MTHNYNILALSRDLLSNINLLQFVYYGLRLGVSLFIRSFRTYSSHKCLFLHLNVVVVVKGLYSLLKLEAPLLPGLKKWGALVTQSWWDGFVVCVPE